MVPNFSQSEARLTGLPRPSPLKGEIFEMMGIGNNRATGLCGGTDQGNQCREGNCQALSAQYQLHYQQHGWRNGPHKL